MALFAVWPTPLAAQAVSDRLLVTGTLAFDAEATLGDFTGTTTTVAGRIVGAERLARVRGNVTAPARSLVTGNGHRDRDMYKSLEVDRYPALRFDLDSVITGTSGGDSTAVKLAGRFTLHGVSRPVMIAGWIWLAPGETRFRGAVPLDLTDFRIGGLTKLFGTLRMQPQIVVRIDLRFRP